MTGVSSSRICFTPKLYCKLLSVVAPFCASCHWELPLSRLQLNCVGLDDRVYAPAAGNWSCRAGPEACRGAPHFGLRLGSNWKAACVMREEWDSDILGNCRKTTNHLLVIVTACFPNTIVEWAAQW